MKTTDSTVFVVDDDSGVRKSLRMLIRTVGLQVETFASADEFLEAYECDRPGCLVLDIRMPKLDGREALRQLRQAGNWTPVILLTQVGESAERAMALEEGADDYLNKPFDPHELVARMRAVLRRARPGQPSLARDSSALPVTLCTVHSSIGSAPSRR